jgi:hypothetical protein
MRAMDVRERAVRGAQQDTVRPCRLPRWGWQRRRSAHVSLRILLSSAFGLLLLSGPVRAGDPWEFWPELNLYKRLGPTTRLYFVAAYAEGKESQFRTLDVAAYMDVTFKPFTRELVKHDDWRSADDWRQKR